MSDIEQDAYEIEEMVTYGASYSDIIDWLQKRDARQAPANVEVEPVGVVSSNEKTVSYFSGRFSQDITMYKTLSEGTELYTHPPAKVPERDIETIRDAANELADFDIGTEDLVPALFAIADRLTTPTPATTPETEWVKCEDQLPKVDQRVQLFSQGVIQNHMPIFDEDDEGLFWDFEIHDHNPRVDFERDQWRPMPTPPQEQ